MKVLESVRGLLARRPVWESKRHFAEGDMVLLAIGGGDDFAGRVTWIRPDEIGVAYSRPWLADDPEMRTRAPRGQLRHAHGCEPCRSSMAELRLEAGLRESAYWDRWDPADRQAHAAAIKDMVVHNDHTLAFGPDTPVWPWLRAEFDGRMWGSECPSLSLARVTKPHDWGRIVREHPEFRLAVWEGQQLPGPGELVEAYELLRERGRDPWLDVELEMKLVDGSIVVSGDVTALGAEQPLDDETYDQVAALMGREANQFPCSTMYRPMRADGPGKDHDAPFQRGSIKETSWDW